MRMREELEEKLMMGLTNLPEYRQVWENLKKGMSSQVIGLERLPRALFLASCYQKQKKAMLVLAENQEEAVSLKDNLAACLPKEKVLLFPDLELLPFEVYGQNSEVSKKRLAVLSLLSLGEKVLVVAWVDSLARRLPPATAFREHHIHLNNGVCLPRERLTADLTAIGYSRESLCEVPGSFALRGSVVDIFPINAQKPLRIDFFDDEVESLRWFDPASQRSGKILEDVFLLAPARELHPDMELMEKAARVLDLEITKVAKNLAGMARRNLLDRFRRFPELLRQGILEPGMEHFLPAFYPDGVNLCQYLPQDGILVLNEPQALRESLQQKTAERQAYYYDLLEGGQLLPSFADNFYDFNTVRIAFEKQPMLSFAQLPQNGGFHFNGSYHIESRGIPSYQGHLELLWDDIAHWQREHYEIFFAASSTVRVDKTRELLFTKDHTGIPVLEREFTQGFESAAFKMAVVTEKELLGQEAKPKRRPLTSAGEKIQSFTDLTIGDYVVHVHHGIGRYMGVERLRVDGVDRDYLKIQYAGADRLFVPVDQMDLVQKYIGNEGKAPKIYKMGGAEWQKVKNRVRASVQDMAKELLRLYSIREAAKGYACGPDTPWQQEFEDAFPFPETPDQLQAVAEIKSDMENPRPMDRLLCGDVGYGKTEVALRAAFKMVMEGKQVAILVPTTILAQQHLRTFAHRLEGYPVKLGVLNRFVSGKAVKETLRKLESGEIDIVVGTHRLLSKDIRFKDLGLLIIDEEQRFGVAHKEKIKTWKENVDVLTLTATPIPRTLHMSLVGMRDMSVINTPPEDRLPIQTYVVEYHPHLVEEAIRRELTRKGQVYFIHNKVETIYGVSEELSKMVPEAVVAVAHGQMREGELERVMLDFIEGGSDVLVCTTIAEAGLDIPNVNTLIVDQADALGLAQLYQLRGRVGRSHRQAFAYFTYHQNHIMNENAKKRLIAIRDFTELGAGFKIAMRDMEIRGAGNILGPEQHGHIAAVGFDMYCRLVQEEMSLLAEETKNEQKAPEKGEPPRLELAVNAFIPDDYIDDDDTDLKIELYRRIAGIDSLASLNLLQDEISERFGKLPETVANLFAIGGIKYLAQKASVSSITQEASRVLLSFREGHPLTGEILLRIAAAFGNKISFENNKKFSIKLFCTNMKPGEMLEFINKVLHQLITLL